MKSTYLLIAFLMSAGLESRAQNTFPSTGNVGIGTTSPSATLDVMEQYPCRPSEIYQLPGEWLTHIRICFWEAPSRITQMGLLQRLATGEAITERR